MDDQRRFIRTVRGAADHRSMFKKLFVKHSGLQTVITFAGIVALIHSICLQPAVSTPRFRRRHRAHIFLFAGLLAGRNDTGDQMRIDILSPDSSFITKRHARLHFTRYDYNQNTSTYEVTPADSLNTYNNLSMKVILLDWQRGCLVNLIDLTASAQPLVRMGRLSVDHTAAVITGISVGAAGLTGFTAG